MRYLTPAFVIVAVMCVACTSVSDANADEGIICSLKEVSSLFEAMLIKKAKETKADFVMKFGK